jgi:hypothetical protein
MVLIDSTYSKEQMQIAKKERLNGSNTYEKKKNLGSIFLRVQGHFWEGFNK